MTIRAHEKMVWDGPSVARLKKLVAADTPTKEIANIFGCSRNAIVGKIYRLGLSLDQSQPKPPRVSQPKADPLEGIFFNGEPLQFAEVDRPCARCAVRESQHQKHGCGQFAAEVRVRLK